MAKPSFAVAFTGAGLLVLGACVARPHTVEIRPASGEEVEVSIRGGDSLQFRANATGLRTDARRIVAFTAPGTLEITAGEGELELSTADTAQRFLLIVKREVAGVTHELETRGQWAVIRVQDGQVKIQSEAMTMREVRAP
jgi:hypothetical protein